MNSRTRTKRGRPRQKERTKNDYGRRRGEGGRTTSVCSRSERGNAVPAERASLYIYTCNTAWYACVPVPRCLRDNGATLAGGKDGIYRGKSEESITVREREKCIALVQELHLRASERARERACMYEGARELYSRGGSVYLLFSIRGRVCVRV